MSNTVSSKDVILNFIDERVDSAEEKRKYNQKMMNRLKVTRIISGVISVSLVSLISGDWLNNSLQPYFNIAAITTTTITAISAEIYTNLGYEKRFLQNVRASGQLRTLRQEIILDIAKSHEHAYSIDYSLYMKKVVQILENQNTKFESEIEKTSK